MFFASESEGAQCTCFHSISFGGNATGDNCQIVATDVACAQLCIIIPLHDLQGQGNLFLNYHFFIFKVLNVCGIVIFFYIFKN